MVVLSARLGERRDRAKREEPNVRWTLGPLSGFTMEGEPRARERSKVSSGIGAATVSPERNGTRRRRLGECGPGMVRINAWTGMSRPDFKRSKDCVAQEA